VPDLEAGQQLGRNYVVVNLLGKGWEGEVYRVRERGTGIDRAAKLFYPRRNPHGKALRRYARKLNKLKDVPIIIQYHHRDTAVIDGRSVEFMVSEYVEGELLSALIERQPGKRFSSFEALHILRAIAAGVAPIHQAGEYHGDLHSDNLIIRRKGVGFRIKLVDLFDLGRPSKEKIARDAIDLAFILHELTGGAARYRRAGQEIKQLVRGLKHGLILERYRNAGELVSAIDALGWE
jgi:serine/threonine protein kinase